jgi:hypothetical protein
MVQFKLETAVGRARECYPGAGWLQPMGERKKEKKDLAIRVLPSGK